MLKVTFSGFKNDLSVGAEPGALFGQILFTPSKDPKGPHFCFGVHTTIKTVEAMEYTTLEDLHKAMEGGVWP